MTIRVKVTGLKEIEAALKELPRATSKNVARRVLKARAQPIAEMARRLAPVDDGTLRESIAVSTKLSKRQRSLHKKRTKDTVEMFVGAGTNPQAHMQEFGTEHNPPQPFLRPAWDANKESFLAGIADDLWAEIKKAADRRARKLAKAGG